MDHIQQEGIRVAVNNNMQHKVMEDYAILGTDLKTLARMDDKDFFVKYANIIEPLNQFALNMGYEIWH